MTWGDGLGGVAWFWVWKEGGFLVGGDVEGFLGAGVFVV